MMTFLWTLIDHDVEAFARVGLRPFDTARIFHNDDDGRCTADGAPQG